MYQESVIYREKYENHIYFYHISSLFQMKYLFFLFSHDLMKEENGVIGINSTFKTRNKESLGILQVLTGRTIRVHRTAVFRVFKNLKQIMKTILTRMRHLEFHNPQTGTFPEDIALTTEPFENNRYHHYRPQINNSQMLEGPMESYYSTIEEDSVPSMTMHGMYLE